MNTTLEKPTTQAQQPVSNPTYKRFLLVTRTAEHTVASYQETTSENAPVFVFKG
jgi:hypothetical protein